MNTRESTYVKILRWGYEMQSVGFTQEQVFKKFNLLTQEERDWYVAVFRKDPVLIDSINYGVTWTLSAEGMSAAVNYLNLREAQESGIQAKRLALMAIWIGITVGISQIMIGLWQIYLSYFTLQ